LKKEQFLTYCSRLSNIELSKILKEKDKYQPGAINASNEILLKEIIVMMNGML